MPLHKKDVPPGLPLIKPTWDEITGTKGVTINLGVYQFYPYYAIILAPMRVAFAGVLLRLFRDTETRPGEQEQTIPRAIWPHTAECTELLEATLKYEHRAQTGWRELLAGVDTITLPKVYPWLRTEQTIAAANKGLDLRSGDEGNTELPEKGDTKDG